ncbi:MAG: radical SAM protein [Candidatus Omnitrophota bacterium]
MKTLFIIPSNKSLFGHKYTPPGHPHVGIAYLAAFLRDNDLEVKIYDDGFKDNPPLNDEINNYKPDIIGITSFSFNYEYARGLISSIKSKTDIPIVIGGPHVSVVKKDILNDSMMDFAIKQEGEISFTQLLEEILKPSPDFGKIKGLIWRKNGQVIENPDMPFIQDLDRLPFPDYNLFDLKKYACYKVRSLPIITSRGCPFNCNYCATLLSMGRCFRKRSGENVFKEIKNRYQDGYVNFDFNDDCFTLDIKRVDEICDLIISNGIKIHFQCYNGLRVDNVTPELLKKMKKAGCFFLAFGCETGNPDVMKVIKKSITLEQVRNAVNWANAAGIKNCVNFIVGHTQETYEQAKETLEFASSLKTNYINFSNLIPYPETEAFDWAKENANFLVPIDAYLMNISTYDNQPIFETKEFTSQERREISEKGHDLYYHKILIWRLGAILGNIVYYFTRYPHD